ncbi:MAG: DsbA family protein [Azospirillum sp.]|nr:DsbA family protein [Azospirillum sp.]
MSGKINSVILGVAAVGAAAVLFGTYAQNVRFDRIEQRIAGLEASLQPEALESALRQAAADRQAAQERLIISKFAAGIDAAIAGSGVPIVNAQSAGPAIHAVIDMSCPHCRTGRAQMMELAAAGKKIVTIPVGMLGEASRAAAISSLALGRISQEASMSFIEKTFERGRPTGETVAQDLLATLSTYGISLEAYTLAASSAVEDYDALMKFVESAGVRGVPFYHRDGRAIFGASSEIALRLGVSAEEAVR